MASEAEMTVDSIKKYDLREDALLRHLITLFPEDRFDASQRTRIAVEVSEASYGRRRPCDEVIQVPTKTCPEGG